MSNMQKQHAVAISWNGPFFLPLTGDLNSLYDRINITGVQLDKIAQQIGKQVGQATSMVGFRTSDRYSWLRVLIFQVNCGFGGRVAIAFPQKNDFYRKDGTSLDRSIALYTSSGTEKDMAEILSLFISALEDFARKGKNSPR